MKIMRFILIVLAFTSVLGVYTDQALAKEETAQTKYTYQKVDEFLGENREMYARDLSNLTNSPITNQEENKQIIVKLQTMENDLGSYCEKLQDYITKTKHGEYVVINLKRWPAFVPDLTATIITKDEYIDKASDAALNPAPEKENFILTVNASTDYIKEKGLQRLEESEKLLEEVKKWKSHYINKLAKSTESAEPGQGVSATSTATPSSTTSIGGPAWALDKTIIDPAKITGVKAGSTVWTIESEKEASGVDAGDSRIKKAVKVSGIAPYEFSLDSVISLTVNVTCDATESKGQCSVSAGVCSDGCAGSFMNCNAVVDGKEMEKGYSIEGHGKQVNKTATYHCSFKAADYDRAEGLTGFSIEPYIYISGYKEYQHNYPIVVYRYKKKK